MDIALAALNYSRIYHILIYIVVLIEVLTKRKVIF